MVTILKSVKILGMLTLAPIYVQASVAHLTYNNQKITHVGTRHVHDAHDYQYQALEKAWKQFLNDTADQPRCVIIEHPTQPSTTFESLETAIAQYADWGAALHLAQQEHIPIIPGDPLRYKVFQDLANSRDFNPDHVKYTFFALTLEIFNRLIKDSTVSLTTNYIQQHLDQTFPGTSLADMIALHEKITHRTFDLYDHHFYQYITYFPPMWSLRGFFRYTFPAFKEVRAIMEMFHIKRDIATIALIKEQLEKGKHVFIVYGIYHQAFQIQGLNTIIAGVTHA